jgi:hypothetical protein
MKRNRMLKQVTLLKDRAFVAVVSNVPMPWLAPLRTIILLSLIAGIVLDASGLFFPAGHTHVVQNRLAGVLERDST